MALHLRIACINWVREKTKEDRIYSDRIKNKNEKNEGDYFLRGWILWLENC
jgi:hypothetical protein